MAYDPQANRRRPRPDADAPAPVDALLGDPVPPSSGGDGPGPVADDPPPSPAVTPAPADPVPDSLLVNTGIAGAVAAAVALLTLRHLWRRHRTRRVDEDSAER